MRRFDEAVRFDVRYTERQGAYGIVVRDRRILLTHQADPLPEFQLPGGGIDEQEGPLQALRREVLEETGWSVHPKRYFCSYRRYVFMPEYGIWARKTHRVYLCTAARRTGPPTENFHTAHWVTADQAISLLSSAGDRHMLRRAVSVCGTDFRRVAGWRKKI